MNYPLGFELHCFNKWINLFPATISLCVIYEKDDELDAFVLEKFSINSMSHFMEELKGIRSGIDAKKVCFVVK